MLIQLCCKAVQKRLIGWKVFFGWWFFFCFVFVALINGFMFAAVVTLFLNSSYWKEGTPKAS